MNLAFKVTWLSNILTKYSLRPKMIVRVSNLGEIKAR